MELEELFDKATPRPWGKFISTPDGEVFGGQGPPWPNFVSSTDFELARHAVNRLKGLLEAAKGVLPYLPRDQGMETKIAHVEAANALRKQIRQTEKVSA